MQEAKRRSKDRPEARFRSFQRSAAERLLQGLANPLERLLQVGPLGNSRDVVRSRRMISSVRSVKSQNLAADSQTLRFVERRRFGAFRRGADERHRLLDMVAQFENL